MTVIWVTLISLFAGYETWTITNKTVGDTFSEKTREWWHVKSPIGRAAFLTVLACTAIWYGWHIVWQQ